VVQKRASSGVIEKKISFTKIEMGTENSGA